jgi:diadenosine tetraphosphatase ApaH/serine/threonine PP2A family protein phosphatase
MVVQAGEGLLINPGSVGQPRDYNPDASFAILDAQARCIVHRRVRYDVDAYQRRLKQLGWGEGPRLMLSRLR